jgi:hypothetical protein
MENRAWSMRLRSQRSGLRDQGAEIKGQKTEKIWKILLLELLLAAILRLQ